MPILPQLPMWRDKRIAANVIIAWPSTNASIPAGWTRETALDGQYPKMVPTSATNPGSTGGAATHTHPFGAHSAHVYTGHNHSGSWGTSSAASAGGTILIQNGLSSLTSTGHTHTSSSTAAANITFSANTTPTNTDTAVSDPLNVAVIFIKSTGAAIGIPSTAVVWYNGAAPAGWSPYSTLDTRFMKGAAAAGDGGAQGGTDGTAHTHTSAAHSHPVGGTHTHVVALDSFSADSTVNQPQFAGDTNAASHTHTLGTSTTGSNPANSDTATETTGTGDGTPAWFKLRAIQRTANADLKGIIAMWLGTIASIPAGWIICDGNNGTPNLSNGKFAMAAASDGTVGNTGGATTHTHAAGTAHTHGSTGTHNHTFTGASSTVADGSRIAGTFANMWQSGHNHPSTTYTSSTITVGTSSAQATTQSANSSNNPVYTEVAYIQKS